MGKKKQLVATHTSPDPDVIMSIWLLIEYGGLKLENMGLWFLKGQNVEMMTSFINSYMIDRGLGKFDHHRRSVFGKTSADLIAQELEIVDPYVEKLLGLVRRNDLQGISQSFDLADTLKCLQRNRQVTDEEKIKTGVQIISAVIHFRRERLERDNDHISSLVKEFLSGKKVPEKFVNYLDKLNNPRFNRYLDIVEIILGKENLVGKEQAKEFTKLLLKIIHDDSLLYLKAQENLFEGSIVKHIKEHYVVAKITDNPKFNTAARKQGASIIIQRQENGTTQIYFNNKLIRDDKIVESLVSIIRLEEQLVRERPIPNIDLRKIGVINDMPEWFYFRAENGSGRFILNGSFTTPDIPPSAIALETLVFLAESAIKFYPNFNWAKWKEEAINRHKKMPNKISSFFISKNYIKQSKRRLTKVSFSVLTKLYFNSTVAPAASNFFFISSASSFFTFSFTT